MVARKVVPEGAHGRAPERRLYAKVKFASLGQSTKAKELIATDWPKKVGS